VKKSLETSRALLVVVATTLATSPAFADDGGLQTGLTNIASSARNIILGVLFIVATIYWGLVGYKFLANAPDAKNSLTHAIIGTVLLVIGGAVVTFVRSSFPV
jgi:hypothetical protein